MCRHERDVPDERESYERDMPVEREYAMCRHERGYVPVERASYERESTYTHRPC
jgi:hypothetical protein